MQPNFKIITRTTLQENLKQEKEFILEAPLFMLIKQGRITGSNEEIHQLEKNTVSVFAKVGTFAFTEITDDCQCLVLQYDRSYIRTLTLRLNLLDAFKYMYSESRFTYSLPQRDFGDLWNLANYIEIRSHDQFTPNIKPHLFRHLNYSFLYSCIDKLNQNTMFIEPRKQSEKLVYDFLNNVQNLAHKKLNVSDYAEMQHITTRHLSSTVKEITGMTALDIVHRFQISLAKEQLTTTNHPISEIAFQLGYSDPYSFSHFFKKQTGQNPTDFRINYQG